MPIRPRAGLTAVLWSTTVRLMDEARRATASPAARRRASERMDRTLAVPPEYTILARPRKEADDATRRIDAETEERALAILREALPALGYEHFVVLSEERGVLVHPPRFDPSSARAVLLILIDPIDSTDLAVIAFGGAVALVAVELRLRAEPGPARIESGEILAAVVGAIATQEIYWAEKQQSGAFVDLGTGEQRSTETLAPDASTPREKIILSTVAAKLPRFKQFVAAFGRAGGPGEILDANEARLLLHHGGPLPVTRVASGDIHLVLDPFKGYKCIDYAGALFIAAKAGCKCACFAAKGQIDWAPDRLIIGGGTTLLDQLSATLTHRQRFLCASNADVLAYARDSFFATP